MYIFDLDGTLIDTKKALISAYASTGVRIPKIALENNVPWPEWCSVSNHEQKHKFYPDAFKRLAKPMRLLRYAQVNHSPVITGASVPAVRVIQDRLRPRLNIQLKGATLVGKTTWILETIRDHSSYDKNIIYVDDDSKTRNHIRRYTGCRVMSPDDAYQSLSQQPEQTRGWRVT